MNLVGIFINGMIAVPCVCLVAWFVLSRWLFDRDLVIACLACAVAAAVGRYSYAGPVDGEAFGALVALAGTAVGVLVVCKWWFRRIASRNVY